MRLKGLDLICLIILIIGGINWGLVGLFNFDLVASVFYAVPVLSRLIYILVGICAVYVAIRSPHLVYRRTTVTEERAHPV